MTTRAVEADAGDELSPSSFTVAGEVFERSRKRGDTLEVAMREAARVLHVSRVAHRWSTDSKRPVPSFAWEVLARIASEHRIAVDLIRLRTGRRDVTEARMEAAGVLGRAGLPVSDLASLLRRDRYLVTGDVREFERRMVADDVFRARMERLCTDTNGLAAAWADARRPPRRAASTVTAIEGGV